jgi:hypothetical protein
MQAVEAHQVRHLELLKMGYVDPPDYNLTRDILFKK